MKLLVILLCLLSERFLVHSISYQRFSWFMDYCNRTKKVIESTGFFANPWILLILIVLPIILITALIYCLLSELLFGFIGFLLSLVLFFYCLGPQNVFYPVTHSDTKSANELVSDYFALVNRELFSIIFWFIIAGPIAAVAYRLITLCRAVPEISFQASEITDVLEWVPARLTVLLFLLVGNFQRGFKLYTSYFFARPEFNAQMLSECGVLAVKTHETQEVPMIMAESLVEHAIIVMLVFIALFTLISWL